MLCWLCYKKILYLLGYVNAYELYALDITRWIQDCLVLAIFFFGKREQVLENLGAFQNQGWVLVYELG